ncbi:TIGR03032 family protein [Poseidonibacter parvus]|uniref:TIGR03032 family protein n=1 Tax=Poseidonibacter parvus TaxID=1850254 RepID=A0A1P8KKQ6_9BACT|nr:TIGR03032 family protein [Poseidonibacter parvus]APW65130.1 TIGR03032 family protein [Poseidonibacter parvus]
MQNYNFNPEKNKEEKINLAYSKNIIEFFKQTKISILITTYQTNKIIILGQDNGKIDLRYKDYPRPMGMCKKDGRLYAGLGHSIYQFSNFLGVTQNLEGGNFDACYIPQNIHFTGDIDIHEMEYLRDELYFINTKFSCLCIKEPNSSFKPIWKPPFISLLQPLDKCHLNGFCSKDGEPRYATALGTNNEPLGWRETKANGGVLMDVTTNEILASNLSMPHSPRWHQEKLYLLESGKGTISRYDFDTKEVVDIARVPGFTRGLDIVGDFAFIGVSKVRESATFSGLEITKLPKRVSGVWIVNIKTGDIVSFVEFKSGVDEVFAITVLPYQKLEILNQESKESKINYMIDNEDIEEVKMPVSIIEQASTYFEKGNDSINGNRKEEAIIHFKKALEIQKDHLPSKFNLAICLGDLKRYNEAEKILFEVISSDASILESYDSLGFIYYKKGDFKKAEENFKKILEYDPGNVKAKNSLEILKREQNDRS